MIRVVAYLHWIIDNWHRANLVVRRSGFLRFDQLARLSPTLIIEFQRIYFSAPIAGIIPWSLGVVETVGAFILVH